MSLKTFNDDKLERHKYGKFIETLLKQQDKFKRSSETNSFVIAIDSPWGTGKTFFIDMLSDQLEHSEDPTFIIAKYNAWENDFWDNAFEPLMQSILNDERINDVTSVLEDKGKDFASKLKTALKSVVKGVCFNKLRNIAGDDAIEAVGELVGSAENFVFNNKEFFPDLVDFQNNINELKNLLTEYVDLIGDKSKLVIILDELDRCKPLFAIQTLEIVKHLFNVKGLTFIFSLDIKQLSSSLKAVYGNNMDTDGYLIRFFDYISKMPSPRMEFF